MFKLGQDQLVPHRKEMADDFEARTIAHVKRVFPEVVAELPEIELREQVSQGIARAEALDLTTRYEIMCYVDAALLLGRDFDRKPEHAWSHAVLKCEDLDKTERADLLLATACSLRYDHGTDAGA